MKKITIGKTLVFTFQKNMKYKEVWNDGRNKFTNYVDTRSNNVNPNGENVVAINLKLFQFFFLKNC